MAGPRGPTVAVIALALGSGAVDAFGFTVLGAVFASVMTGNLVLFGIAAVHVRPGPALSAGTAIGAYVAGVFTTSAWLGRPAPGRHLAVRRRPRPRTAVLLRGMSRPGPAGRIRAVWGLVPVVQAAVLAGWLLCRARPDGAAQAGLLALSAFAMGVQSTGVNTLPLRGAATTYLTGTLTVLTTELATSGVPATMRRRFAVLAAALIGAGMDAALLAWARPAAPALPLAATLTAAAVLGRAR
jgi:uncharacterized membrane protein YoaK (UPF0700 family)